MHERLAPTRPERFTSSNEFEYRRLQARAFDCARRYDGSEKADIELFETLGAWEYFISTQVNAGSLRDKETEAALTWNEHHPKEISDALEAASNSFLRHIQQSLSAEGAEKTSALAQEYYDNVFLPTKSTPELPGEQELGHSAEEQEEKIDHIIENFLSMIREYGVYSDDIILTRSKKPEYSQRKASYVKIEIPRIGRVILLCHQKRQATFVIHGTIANVQLAHWSKHELLAQTEIPARRIERGAQWNETVLNLLFSEDAWENPEYKSANARHRAAHKIDIGQLQEYRSTLITAWRTVYTPESFIEAGTQALRARIPDGTNLVTSARILGIPGKCATEASRLQFALAIWPNHPRVLKEIGRANRTPDEWRAALNTLHWTPQRWITTDSGSHRRVKFDEYIGVMGLASLFGVSGKPLESTVDWLRVGQAIWPESKEITEALRIEQRTPQEWVQRIREAFTPKQWIAILRTPGYQPPTLDGKGPAALAALCKYSEIILSFDRNIIMRFGQFLWPESKEIAHEVALHNRSVEDWRRAAQQKITPQEWLAMTSQKALAFEVDGLGMVGLASKLGFDDRLKSLTGNTIERLKLGLYIWPDNTEIQSALTKAIEKKAL